MPYTVNFTDDNKEPITVQDVSLDESTSIKLVGRDYKGYGEFIAENFLHILENFASPLPPENPIEGQVWYDRSSNQLKVFSTNNAWRTISGNFAGFSEPTGPDRVIGDIWYNSANRNLYVYNGEGWVFFASALIPDEGEEEGGIPYVTLDTEQVITAFKEFADEIATNKLTISNDNSGTVLLDLIDTSTPGTNKVMMRLTGNGNPLLVLNNDTSGDYEFRSGDTALRIDDGTDGVENLRRINGVWTTILGVNTTGVHGTAVASEAESREKTSNTKIMTPARVYHAVDHFVANTVANGGIQATQAEAEAAVANDVVMTPLRTKQLLDANGLVNYAEFRFITPAGHGGGDISQGYNDRAFNTVVKDTIGITLSNSINIRTTSSGTTSGFSILTLPPGKYLIDAESRAYSYPDYIMIYTAAIRTSINRIIAKSINAGGWSESNREHILNVKTILEVSSPTGIKYSVKQPYPFGVSTSYTYESKNGPVTVNTTTGLADPRIQGWPAYSLGSSETETFADGTAVPATEHYDILRIVKLG
jgi:hypothetical protein